MRSKTTNLSAIASLMMVIAAYETLNESQKQWEDAHTAHISVMAYQDKYHQVLFDPSFTRIGL
jgi:hypothetical protein